MRGGTLAKICTSCLEEKKLDAFYSKGSTVDSQCKSCHKQRKRQVRAKASKTNGDTVVECAISIKKSEDWPNHLLKVLKEYGYIQPIQKTEKPEDDIEKILKRKRGLSSLLGMESES